MKLRILGSGAGGGLPQWNCGCANCAAARSGSPQVPRRSQASAAVSTDGEHWFLLDATPDLRSQLEAFPGARPRRVRDTPICGVLLTSGQIDASLGLLVLREWQPLTIWCTATVRRGLVERNALFGTLQRFAGHSRWISLSLGQETSLSLPDGRASGLTVEAIPSPGKLPPHLHGEAPSAEDNVGLLVHERRTARTLAYFPSVGAPADQLEPRLRPAHCVIFDGTFWRSDDLRSAGAGSLRAEDLAHLPLDGPQGSLALLSSLKGRRLLTHVNNTNPIADCLSPARRRLAQLGVEVASDGQELELS